MKIQYLGTAAAEGVPALFCNCRVCTDAREHGGKNIRMRCCAAVNDTVLIDFSPDIFTQSVKFNINLCETRAIFFTHSHIDHLASSQLCLRHKWYSNLGEKPLHIYGNKASLDEIKRQIHFDVMESEIPYVHLHLLEAFVPVVVDELTITPIPANHALNENAFIFLIEEGDKKYLYCNDTGILADASVEFLRDKMLVGAGLDCTSGNGKECASHMSLTSNRDLKEKLLQQNSANDKTLFMVVHFSHNNGSTHAELVESAKEFLVAYDGIKLEF